MSRSIRTCVTCVILVICGCSPIKNEGVDWENYDSTVKTRIDTLAAERDCAGLQREFDIAEKNNAVQRRRVGDGNDDLMGYINDKMREANCYD